MRGEIAKYIEYYNKERPHQGIGGRPPAGFSPEEIINNSKKPAKDCMIRTKSLNLPPKQTDTLCKTL